MKSSRLPLLVPVALLLGLSLVAAACTKSGEPADNSGNTSSALSPNQFAAEIASVDMIAGEPQRVSIGIFWSDDGTGVQLLSFGEVQLRFLSLGKESADDWQPGPEATGTYLPAPGTALEGEGPALEDPNIARGVYVADDVTFDHAGIWTAEVTATIAGEPITIRATPVEIGTKHAFPAPGDRAIPSENLTMDSKGVPLSAIDSWAANGEPVPDPELHATTIADAMKRGRPVLVLFSTPAYCISRFCGPDVEALADLAKRYGDRAEFIHVEIWKDNQENIANDAANEWVNRDGSLVEPWLFLIDAKGRIVDRWGPLFDPDEVGGILRALPPMGN